MTTHDQSTDEPWESVQRTYEGFPLFLRRPVGLDFDSLSPNLPVHMTLTHEFSFRRFDGAPEPKYNKTLEEFDVAATRYFSGSGRGQIVLVETFGGNRHYYFYVGTDVDPKAVADELSVRFPGMKLSAESQEDRGWTFIRRYTVEYLDRPNISLERNRDR